MIESVSYPCRVCGSFSMLYPESHRCPPLWVVHEPMNDFTREVYAYDAEEAAEKFAEEWDEEDHSLLDCHSSGVEVVVTDSDGVSSYWCVIGEAVPQYSAYESTKRERAK